MSRFGLLVAFAVLPACGEDTFAPSSQDAAPDALMNPDGTTPGDSSVPDASRETSTLDSAVVDAAPPPFSCSPAPLGTILCTQFEGLAVQTGWTGPIAFNGGTNKLDTSTFVSPTHSYLATTVPPDAGVGVGSASLLEQSFTGSTYKTLSARVMLRVHSIGSSQHLPLLRLSYPAGTGTDSASATVSGGRLFLEIAASGGATTSYDVAPLPADTWTLVELDLTPPPAVVDVSIYVGGVLAKSVSPALDMPPGERDATLGIIGSDSTAVDAVNFDDFLLRGL